MHNARSNAPVLGGASWKSQDGCSAVIRESEAGAHGNISQVRVLSNKSEKMRELLHLASLYEHELAAMPAWAKVQTAQFERSTADAPGSRHSLLALRQLCLSDMSCRAVEPRAASRRLATSTCADLSGNP